MKTLFVSFVLALTLLSNFNSSAAVLVEYNFDNSDHYPTFVDPNVVATPLLFTHLAQTYDGSGVDTRSWATAVIPKSWEFTLFPLGGALHLDSVSFNGIGYPGFGTTISPLSVNGSIALAFELYTGSTLVDSRTVSIDGSVLNGTLFQNNYNLDFTDPVTVKLSALNGYRYSNIYFDNIIVEGTAQAVNDPNVPAVPEVSTVGASAFGLAIAGYLLMNRQKCKI